MFSEALVDDNEAVDDDAVAAEWATMTEDDGEGDDDDVAAEWATMVEDSDADNDDDNSGPVNRVLNQDEIDSLLGFDDDGDGDGQHLGIRAIINSALVSYERLPMLEVVFDRLVRLLSTSLRNFTADNVEVSLDNITSIRFAD